MTAKEWLKANHRNALMRLMYGDLTGEQVASLMELYAASEVERVAGNLAVVLKEAKEHLLASGYADTEQKQFGAVILRTINLALAAYNEAVGKKG